MANWANHAPSGSATRRKWNLEDRESLNNLKFHIASEGCSDVQFDLACQLLNNEREKTEATSNQQAVRWLLCAAQQGHEEAAKLLRKCYVENCGITSDNESEVRSCLAMSPGERAARKAARELFACLSNGSEHITPKQLERQMRKIYNMQKKRRHHGYSSSSTSDDDEPENDKARSSLENTPKSIQNDAGAGDTRKRRRRTRGDLPTVSSRLDGDRRLITEDNLVSAAANYAAGHLPSVSDALILSVPDPSSLDHVPCFHRLLFHPIIFFTLLYHRLINFIVALPASVPPNVRLATLFLIYWLASSENLALFLPIGFYYACWIVMVWSTCRMLKTKHAFIDFRIWSGLFLSYGDHNVEADISENRFLRNNLKPYLYFFCAFIGSLLVHPLIISEWLPHSELTIISCVLVFISLGAFMFTSPHRLPDWIVLISFAVNVLAKYPYEMDDVVNTGWRFLDLKVPTFCSFVIGNGIEFCLNCRTALYLIIPGFLLHIAKRSNWHGTYTYLIPHCVTLSWLQLCIASSQSATMFGVMRGTLGLAGVLLFLPLFGIVSILLPVFVAIDWMGFTDANIRLGSTLLAIVLALLASCSLAINRTTRRYVTVLQLLTCLIAASILILPYMTSNFKDVSRFGSTKLIAENKHINDDILTHGRPVRLPPPISTDSVSWQRFYELCGPPAWTHQNRIKAQMRCSHLDGMTVDWEGSIAQVQIGRFTNIRQQYIEKLLPNWLGNIVRCLFGANIKEDLSCDVKKDTLCAEIHEIVKNHAFHRTCSLHKWNTYEYEITVKMAASLLSKGGELVLLATHNFGNFTQRLAAGDHVRFLGKIQNSRHMHEHKTNEDMILGGTSHVYVKLTAIECRTCLDRDIPPILESSIFAKSSVDARLRDLSRGIKYLLNVLLNPLITFK